MEISKYLLLPFTLLYGSAVKLRNFIYDKKLRSSIQFETNVIVVGNLEAGGTGKTPMVTYLIELLKGNNNIATLSRGYKRNTKGFRIASTSDTPKSIGDEPFIYFSRYPDVTVSVGETRETAIPFILAEKPETDIILMDDGYQYRTVIPSLSILLTRFDRLFTDDWLIPSGRLRESRSGANRASIIIVTKSPDNLDPEEQIRIKSAIKKYSKAEVFFSKISYGEPIPIIEGKLTNDIVLVTGIAHSDAFVKHLSEKYNIVKHFNFPDHHSYTKSEWKNISEYCSAKNLSIITSEKDAVKWDKEIVVAPSFFIPISTHILNNGTQFEELLRNSIREYENPY